jgi:hypothetical protein
MATEAEKARLIEIIQEQDAEDLELIREAVDSEALADYLTADADDWFVVWTDGTCSIMEGSTRPGPEQAGRILGMVRCPGLGNADMTYWRDGWDCGHLSDEEVIRDCCENEDVIGEAEDLVRKLFESATDE